MALDDIEVQRLRDQSAADQARAGMVEVAHGLVAFRKVLLAGGFTTDESYDVTRDYFDEMMFARANAVEDDEDDD